MGRVIQILVAVVILMAGYNYAFAASNGSWWWTSWWGDDRVEQQEQQEQIQKKVTTKCDRDVEYWRKQWAERPNSSAYKQYYLEAKKQCEREKAQYDRKWK